YPKPASPEHSIAKKNDLLPELSIETVAINNLQQAKHNVRKQSSRQIAKCRASIERYGLKRSVLITADNEIIDGHAIVEAARHLGLTELPVDVKHMPSSYVMRTNLPSASFFSLSASGVRPTSTLSPKKGMVLLLPFGAKKDVFAPTDGFATC
ncbi:ParB N-terminal domain-containing protein, partial [Ruegeria arenilitoris]|uniref:ParB N-terminal domain-containing protein n=1 Tax=Ruegeria arenilitoris TaxID=1173585 RepID=UPI001C2C4F72